VTRDTLGGTQTEIQSLNRFVYTKNNPIRLIDPSGNASWADLTNAFKVFKQVKQGKELYDFADQATQDESLYWAWRYARSLNPNKQPTREDIQMAKDFGTLDTAKIRYMRDLGKGVQTFFGNPIVNWLFPMKWRGPENDTDYQEWLKTYSQGGAEEDPAQGDYGYWSDDWSSPPSQAK
jgi:hypothetical protein